ncbi:MAG: hypothetical protein DWQ31_08745 [Planctomycetota bacterium]|nr:MAG: hypothetical protein DWQ31_08745 [Planctomycetota bacterium]REJ86923.1 MAG: hypothetical protein DWQ35_22425 [Planctomycetota bacterium]REK24950.1 MAG: hypothetical protein DWQ42_12745 [Planctomycetota bacterium]REK48539.1 MAG: hypothetical protein DWQ46_02275 [Planctomycetota bacterium]
MTIHEHIEEFAGFKIQPYTAGSPLPAPPNYALRLEIGWEASENGESFEKLFAELLNDPICEELQALIIGDWGETSTGNDSQPIVEALVNARDKLPNLKALFLGELTMEESEISWINQSDVSPLFEAFPNLEQFYVRGGNGLSLGRPRHARLQRLVIETGGMSAELVREVTSAELPALEHLELWLGDDGYGNNIRSDDISSLLSTGPVAKLRYLGLRDDCNADETAQLLARQGIPESVEVLDLSMGILTDVGATALAESNWISSLKKLDIHFHYVSPAVVERLNGLVTELDASDHQEGDEDDGEVYRYVAVSE